MGEIEARRRALLLQPVPRRARVSHEPRPRPEGSARFLENRPEPAGHWLRALWIRGEGLCATASGQTHPAAERPRLGRPPRCARSCPGCPRQVSTSCVLAPPSVSEVPLAMAATGVAGTRDRKAALGPTRCD